MLYYDYRSAFLSAVLFFTVIIIYHINHTMSIGFICFQLYAQIISYSLVQIGDYSHFDHLFKVYSTTQYTFPLSSARLTAMIFPCV